MDTIHYLAVMIDGRKDKTAVVSCDGMQNFLRLWKQLDHFSDCTIFAVDPLGALPLESFIGNYNNAKVFQVATYGRKTARYLFRLLSPNP